MNLSNFPWLLRWLGADSEEIGRDADAHLLWLNAPSSWTVFVMLAVVGALCAGVIYLYRREINTCPRRAKWLLTGLRLAVVAILVLVFLDPVVRFDYRRVLEPSVVLLRDASQSMDLGLDRYADETAAARVAGAMGSTPSQVQASPPSRVAIVNHLLSRDNGRLLQELAKRGNLRVFDFAGSVEEVALTRDGSASTRKDAQENGEASLPWQLPPLKATGTSTDLRRAIQEALSDRLVAAIVLFTDGQHTLRATAQDDLNYAAQQAAKRGVPLLVVGVGDTERPRNLAVQSLIADKHVTQDDPFEIRVTLQGDNVADEKVEVKLLERRLDKKTEKWGAEKEVDSKPGKFDISGRAEVKFPRTVDSPGKVQYRVRVAKLPGEAREDDNVSKSKDVVVHEPPRVLLVSGGPTWEYQHLMRLLKREKLAVSGWLQNMDLDRKQDGTEGKIIDKLPMKDEEFLSYAVVILLDPDPDGLSEAWLTQLKSFVGEHSGGLLFMAGPKNTSQLLAQPWAQPLRTLLPIELKDVRGLEVQQMLDPNNRRWKLGVVPASADEPILQFGPGNSTSASTARWQQLPGFYWSLANDGEKDGAKVLLERAEASTSLDGSGRPLLVTGSYGGRTVFIGFHGTWRWRRTPEAGDIYDRFWLQSIGYLIEGRKLGGRHRVEITTNRQTYLPGDPVSVTAVLNTFEPGTGKLKPLQLSKVEAVLRTPKGISEPVSLQTTATAGEYAATLVARHQGEHTISIVSPGESGASPPSDEASFYVESPSVERERSWLSMDELSVLMKNTGQNSENRYFEIGETDQIAAAIPNKRQEVNVPGRTLTLRESMRISLLLTVVGLLGIEWAVRKHYKLM